MKQKRRRLGALLTAIPVIVGGITLYYVFGTGLMTDLANRGNSRLTTTGWQTAQSALSEAEPEYGTKFAYYKLQEGQDLAWAANHFSVNIARLAQLNPGAVLPGTTIMVPPVERQLAPFPNPESNEAGIVVTETNGNVYARNRFINKKVKVTLPQLMKILQPQGVISQLGPKSFVINKPLYIQDNIRVDITNETVDTLYLRSLPKFDVTTLTFQNSQALIKGVTVSSLNPATNKPDTDSGDGRSFLRAYDSARMDMIDSKALHLGMTLEHIRDPAIRAKIPFIGQGGVYGVSWRISSGTFGSNIATGWVENSTFDSNHIGAFTFGASGMMWRGNIFSANEVYGLDPHDDSNNATIEYNSFIANGKHGFIVSKRCNYNIIKNNISINNAGHGFMLHEKSDYNIMKNNISIGNHDNFVIYGSSFNKISHNKSYNPLGSQIRINKASIQNYVQNNLLYGGKKGVYVYGGVNGVDISDNTFVNVKNQLSARGASRVLYTGNTSTALGYQVGASDRVVFGVNSINKHPPVDLKPLEIKVTGSTNGLNLTDLSNEEIKRQQ